MADVRDGDLARAEGAADLDHAVGAGVVSATLAEVGAVAEEEREVGPRTVPRRHGLPHVRRVDHAPGHAAVLEREDEGRRLDGRDVRRLEALEHEAVQLDARARAPRVQHDGRPLGLETRRKGPLQHILRARVRMHAERRPVGRAAPREIVQPEAVIVVLVADDDARHLVGGDADPVELPQDVGRAVEQHDLRAGAKQHAGAGACLARILARRRALRTAAAGARTRIRVAGAEQHGLEGRLHGACSTAARPVLCLPAEK